MLRRPAIRGVATTTIIGLAFAASGASAANSPVQIGGKDRCDPLGPVSLGYYDARRSAIKKGAAGVSYERSGDGRPQRTVYLDGGAYVVSACSPSGAVREEEYRPLGAKGHRVASIYDVAPDGSANGVTMTYAQSEPGDPEPAPPEKRVVLPKTIAQPVIAPVDQALKSQDLKPGSPERVSKLQATMAGGAAQPQGPSFLPSYSGANKCSHDARIALPQKRGSRSFSYFSALGTSVAALVNSGARAFPDLWNYCGWTVGSGLNASYAGDIATFALNSADGVNQIGWNSGTCGGIVVLGCNYPRLAYSGGAWVIAENDIAINPNYPYSNGAVAGRWDLQSLVAHEFGHSWGFADVHDYVDPYAENHVMFSPLQSGIDDRRYLAYGDYQIMRILYP